MKPTLKTNLYRNKPKATQGRTSLQRIRDDLKRRSLRVLLSPISYSSPLKSPRKSITNFSPRKSIVFGRGIVQDGSKGVNQRIEKLIQQVCTPKVKKQRKCAKRKNEAEKLQEDLLSKKYISEGNLFGSRRALRSRLILTPKSPLVRVKRITQQSAKSRKLSLNSLNKFLSRDVRVELEKLPSDEKSLENDPATVDDLESGQVDKNDHVEGPSPVKIRPTRDITILLEKLSPTCTRHCEPEKTDEVLCTPLVLSEDDEPYTISEPVVEVSKGSKYVPRREVRILLDKLPDTVSSSMNSNETGSEHVEVSQIDDVARDTSLERVEKLHDEVAGTCEDDQSTEKPPEKLSTPSREVLSEHPLTPITSDMVSECLSPSVSTITPETVKNTNISGKKTPKSLDIPLRRITIVKSKFAKMNRALESPVEKSPKKIRPTSTYLTSPLAKLKNWKTTETTTQVMERSSSSESSTTDIVSSSSSTVGHVALGESSPTSTPSTSSSLNYKVSSAVPKPRSNTDKGGIPSRTKSTNFDAGSKSVLSDKSSTKSSNEAKSIVAKKIPKSKDTIPEGEKSTSLPSVKSPASSQSVPLCTEVGSPLSRGQLMTAKSLAASPNAPKMILIKSPSHLARSSKSDDDKKSAAKSPLNRGRLLTEQSLASSSKNPNSSTDDKKIHRASSASSILHRSPSNVSSSPIERNNSSMETESDSSDDLSSVAIPLDPTPAPGVFSNSKTCAAILSTLKTSDRNKSKSEPEKLPQWSSIDMLKSSSVALKKTPDTTKIRTPAIKSVSGSQPDLSKKLSEVQIDSTKPSHAPVPQSAQSTSVQKKPFHIPKVVPGATNFYKTNVATPLTSLPRSGFTPSPPTKSSVIRPVLDSPMYNSTSYVATTNSRQLPPKSSQSTTYKTWSKPSANTDFCFKTPWTKPYHSSSSHSSTIKPTSASTARPTSLKPAYSSSSNSSTIKPTSTSTPQTTSLKPAYSSSSNSSTSKPTSTSTVPTTSSKPPYTSSWHTTTITKPHISHSQPLSAKLPHTANSHPSPIKPLYTAPSSNSMTTKPHHSSSSQTSFAKPSTPISFTPPNKPYVPSLELKSQKSSSIPTPSKPPSNRPVAECKPLNVKTPSSGQSSRKSKPRPLKVAYMSSRSSNSASFSKCLPSGPQYSPTYSKYLQNGFTSLPAAQYSLPKAPKPRSPGTSSILRWSTVKPWMSNKPTTTPLQPPTGPTESLTSSTLTSNPSFSPLCPEF